MCQAIAEGGRRCPVHRHTTIAILKIARLISGLNQRQLEGLFRELRREGRGVELPATVSRAMTERLRGEAAGLGEGVTGEINDYLAAEDASEQTDAETLYAQSRLLDRAIERGDRLAAEFEELAMLTGQAVQEIHRRYDEIYAAVDVSRGATPAPEFTETARRIANRTGLPDDPASVVALTRLRQLPQTAEQGPTRNYRYEGIFQHDVDIIGWDEGRLEIHYHVGSPDYDPATGGRSAYRNVPEGTYQMLLDGRLRPPAVVRLLRDNPGKHLYRDEAQAKEDMHSYRCAACGQFRHLDHTCPALARRIELAATGMSTQEIDTVLREERIANGSAYEILMGDETEITDLSMVNDDLRDEVEVHRDDAGIRVAILGRRGRESRRVAGWRGGVNVHYGEDLAVSSSPTAELAEVDGVLTETAINELMREYSLISTIRELAVPEATEALNGLLAEMDVEVPVRVLFAGWREDYWPTSTEHGRVNVTGSIRYAQGTGEIRHRHLQCTCEDYQRDYDCEHVRLITDQAAALHRLAVNESIPAERRIPELVRQHDTEIELERAILSEIEYRRRGQEVIDHEGAARYFYQMEGVEDRAGYMAMMRERQRRFAEERAAEERRAREAAAAREAAERAAAAEIEGYRNQMVERWKDTGYTYAANAGQFYADYRAALSRKRAGKTPVLAMRTENVTDGICADVPGARRFGVELEFEISEAAQKNGGRAAALRKIAEELHAAGLTAEPIQGHYHAAKNNDYAKWSFEEDATVDGELVSPILADTPEAWAQLAQAVEIIKRNGGVASTNSGSHVHISSGSYEKSTAKHVELLRVVNDNSDVLYRLATNPERGKHRGMQWCKPNVQDFDQDIEVGAKVQNSHDLFMPHHMSHSYGLNFESAFANGFTRSNVEFRMWDASLDAAVIQQQVAISAAVTDYAERQVIANQGSRAQRAHQAAVGETYERERTNLEVAGKKTHTAASFAETNDHAADFFDKIFRRREDHAAMASLFAMTSWQPQAGEPTPRVRRRPFAQVAAEALATPENQDGTPRFSSAFLAALRRAATGRGNTTQDDFVLRG